MDNWFLELYIGKMNHFNEILIVMGVAGCGKTTVGNLLAKKLDLPFLDADDFHPLANRQKMQAGRPLNDDDRLPWLMALNAELVARAAEGGCILACSALKAVYRDILTQGIDPVFVYLKADREQIRSRLNLRTNHFMNPSLLDSQFDTLEEPADCIVCDTALGSEAACEKAGALILEKRIKQMHG